MFGFDDDDMDIISISGDGEDLDDPDGPGAFLSRLKKGAASPEEDEPPPAPDEGGPLFDLGALEAQAQAPTPSGSLLDFANSTIGAEGDALYEPGTTLDHPGTMIPVRLGTHSSLFFGDKLFECPQCHRPFKAHEVVVRCPRCQTISHVECWRHVGGCPTEGCDLWPKSSSMAPQPQIGEVRDEQPGDFQVQQAVADVFTPADMGVPMEPGITFVPGAAPSDPGTLIPIVLGPAAPLVTSEDARCLACGDRFVGGRQVVKCPSCLVFTHVECWQDNEGCPQQRCDLEPPPVGTTRERPLPKVGQSRRAAPADFEGAEGGVEAPSAGQVAPIRLSDASPLVTAEVQCLIARRPFAAGDEIIICPECRTPAKLEAWHTNQGCGQEDCALAPPPPGTRRTLGLPTLTAARDEEPSDYPGAAGSGAGGVPTVIQSIRVLRSSPLVENYDAVCPSCQKPYKDNRLVVKCPGCGEPIHHFCWIRYNGCRKQGCMMCSPEYGGALAGPLPLLDGWREERIPNDFGVIQARKTLSEPTVVLQHEAPVSAVAASADGSVVASADVNGTIQIRRLDNPQPLAVMPHGSAPVMALALSPAGDLLASAGADNRVHLHAADTGAHVATLAQHVPWGAAAAFSPDGRYLAVGGCTNKALVWEMGTQQLVAEIPHFAFARAVSFDAASQRLARASYHNTDIGLTEVVSGTRDQGFVSPSAEVRSMCFSTSGSWLAAACTDGHLRLWDVATRSRRGDIEADTSDAVAFVGGDSTLASVGRGGLGLWQASRDGLTGHDSYTRAEAMTSVAAARSCNRLFAGCSSGAVMVFDVEEETDEGGV